MKLLSLSVLVVTMLAMTNVQAVTPTLDIKVDPSKAIKATVTLNKKNDTHEGDVNSMITNSINQFCELSSGKSSDNCDEDKLPKRVKLNVPEMNQYDNSYEPKATCGLTSAAMLISHKKGINLDPDTLYKKYGKAKGQSPEGLASLYRSQGLKGKSSRFASREKIKRLLAKGTPVVIHGYFTRGHIVTITGYDEKGFYVNDPSGQWNGRYKGNYNAWGPVDQHYSYKLMSNKVIGRDGDVWISWVE